MRLSFLARHRYRRIHRLAAVVLVATACGFTGTLAHAQSDDLVAAAERGDLLAVNALLKSQTDVNALKSTKAIGRKTTALIEASSHGHLAVVHALLAAKADLNSKTTIVGRTPLFQSLSSGHWDVARLLVEAGASVNMSSNRGVTALMFVTGVGNTPRSLALVEAMLAAHANPNFRVCSMLYENTPAANRPSSIYLSGTGATALGIASSTGSAEVVQALLAANADANFAQCNGKTPLTIASAYGRANIVRLLLAAKADVNADEDDGKTALMLASANGHLEVVQALVAAKADVNAKQLDGNTALMLALQNDHQEVAELLRRAIAAVQ